MNKQIPFAETINYWKSSNTSPDTWLDKTRKLIEKHGGVVLNEGYGNDGQRAAYLLTFRFGEDSFRIVWPVLPTKDGKNERAARIQAATMIYHDVKTRIISSAVLGTRTAFFAYFLLPDGRQAATVAVPELENVMPRLLPIPKTRTDE